MSIKSLFAAGAVALAALAAPAAHGSAIFQGLTFTFNQTGSNTLTFEISGTPSGDWAGVQYLGAFDLKGLGLDFSAGHSTGTANGPGATNLVGLNSQLSASNVNCANLSNGETGSICFNLNPDTALYPNSPNGSGAFDFLYTITFSDPLNIASSVHLQIAFTDTQGGGKIGSLYSQDVGLGSSGGSSSGSGSGDVPEPATSALLLLGLGLMGMGFVARRKAPHA